MKRLSIIGVSIIIFDSKVFKMNRQEKVNNMLSALKVCNIKWLVVVPTSGLNLIYTHYEKYNRCIYASREEEAVAIATGLALGNEQPIVLIQQSGVGNILNAVFTLSDAYNIPFPIVVCERSESDPNPIQGISSKMTRLALENLNYSLINWCHPNAVKDFKFLLEKQQRWIICPI